ncbi:MAG TPA: hypothetical protein VIG64_14595 [Actinomycetota bacterium]
MTSDRESIFRRQALEHHRRGRGPGDPVRLSPLWTTWAFWSLLASLAIVVAASLLVTLGEDFEGVTVVLEDGRSVVAFFPTTDSGDFEVGDEMTIRLPGAASPMRVPIESIGAVVEPGSRTGLPPHVASVVAVQTQPSIPVYGDLPSDGVAGLDAGLTGTAVVRVEDRLLFEVVPAVKDLFASDG